MRAIEIFKPGSSDRLRITDRPLPTPREGGIRIRVKAAGVARADVLQRQGHYPAPPGASDIPGLDVAGIIDALGSGVTELQAGDQVCAILTGGGYAEFCLAPVQQVLPMPEGWSFIEAATLPENLFTAFDNLVTRAGLKAGERVLIHGGTSGLGSTAIMLSRAIGAVPFATAGSGWKCKACLGFGVEAAINYQTEDFPASIRHLTGGRGVDVILDMVGGPYLAKNLQSLATDGRIAVVATQGGRVAEMDLGLLMAKRARIMGSTMRARSVAEKGQVAERLRNEIWPLLPAKGPIWPMIDSVFALGEADQAHARMESGSHIGKIVLTP